MSLLVQSDSARLAHQEPRGVGTVKALGTADDVVLVTGGAPSPPRRTVMGARFPAPSDGYMQRWTPLVGDRAARVIWSSSWATAAYLAVAFGFAVASSFGFAKSALLGLVLLSAGVVSYFLMIRERMKIVTAFSDYFGTPIRWTQLPSLTPARVARACEQNGWSTATTAGAPADAASGAQKPVTDGTAANEP